MPCRPPPTSPPGMFGPMMHHPGPHHLGPPGRSPSHDFGGIGDRQSPPFFPASSAAPSAMNRESGAGNCLTGFSRAGSPPSQSNDGVDVEQLSPSSPSKKCRDIFITDLQQQTSDKDKSSSRPAASLFQPYLDVDKK